MVKKSCGVFLLLLLSTGAAHAQDAIDLSQVAVYNSPTDVASWPVTTRITNIVEQPTNSAAPGLTLTFSALATWPDYTPPGWDGPLQYTVWPVVKINGQWYTSGIVQMWRGRGATGAPLLTDFAINWVYDSRWGPMQGHQPVVGEQMGFFVTAGNARGVGTVTSVRERSNVVMINVPAGDTGTFNFSAPRNSDINGDGMADLIWRNYATGANQVWFQNATTTTSTASLPVVTDLHWKLVGTADFNGDGHPDMVAHNMLTGENVVTFMNGSTALSGASLPAITYNTRWQPVAVDDFDGDGHPDLLWRNNSTGETSIWFMNGTTMTGAAALFGVGLQWEVAGTGDLDGDGYADIVWRNRVTGDNVFWLMRGGTMWLSGGLPSNPDPTWHIAAVMDMNGDSHPDLVWRNSTTGRTTVTYLVGAQAVGGADFGAQPDLNWSILHNDNVHAPADFDGDGRGDFLWHNIANGTNGIWFMRGNKIVGTAGVPTQPDLNWHLVDAADINGDGWLDLVWHNVSTGAVQAWYGPTFGTTAALPTMADTTWRLVATGDLNADGIPELIWRNTVSGANRVWFLNGTALNGTVDLAAVDPTWALVAVGDLNGDNQADLIWRKLSGPNAGANTVWFMNGTTPTSYVALDPVGDQSWQLVGAVDVNGDGFADLVWQNTGSGAAAGVVAVWYMNGPRVLGYDSLMGADASVWRLVR